MAKVLCVDDDQGILLLLKKRLEKENFEVEAATTFEEAKSYFQPSKYDCILIDYHLPDGEGIELIKLFVETEQTENCVLLTGQGNEKTAIDAFLHGASHYLVKDSQGTFLDLLPAIISQSIDKKNLKLEKIEQDRRLKIAMEEAVKQNQIKDNFLAIMSHELKTPVFALTGFCECLLNGVYGKLEIEQKNAVEKMLTSSHYLNSILSNMLNVTMLERKKITLSKKEFSIKECIDFCMTVVNPLAQEKGLVIEALSDYQNITLFADQEKMNQIIINLLKNAIRYTEKGTIQIKAYKKENTVEIRVKDTGLGIEQEELEQIFQPYTQAKYTKEKKLGGSGLGLTIVKQLVELHGGKISVSSQKNCGSEFIISLPSGL